MNAKKNMDKEIQFLNDFEENEAYDYARFLAFSYYADYYTDDNGEEFCCGCREEGLRLYLDIRNGKAIFPFGKDRYDSNTDVQNSLKALGLDSKKFWHALLYAYYYAESQNTDCISLKPAVQEHVEALIKALKHEGATITITGSDSKCAVSDPDAISFILELLERGNLENNNNGAYVYRTGKLLGPVEDMALTWQMADFYDALDRVIEKYRTDEGLATRASDQVGSRDKELLISRLMYVVKLTGSKNYLSSKNSIRGKKQYWRDNQRPKKVASYGWSYGADISDSTDTDADIMSGATLLVER